MEGKNLIDVKDVKGKLVVREYIDAALKNGSAWVDYYWYRPGENTPGLKHTYVRKVKHGKEMYFVGAGLYIEEETNGKSTIE
jgi:signal transduction histidine kinase